MQTMPIATAATPVPFSGFEQEKLYRVMCVSGSMRTYLKTVRAVSHEAALEKLRALGHRATAVVDL